MSPSYLGYNATARPIRIPSVSPTRPTPRITPNTNLITVPIVPNKLFISVPLLEHFYDFVLLPLCKFPTGTSELRMHLVHGQRSCNAAYRKFDPLPDFSACFDLFVGHRNTPPKICSLYQLFYLRHYDKVQFQISNIREEES